VIDFWKLVKDFSQGDTVQRYAPGQGGYSMSPFVGRVTAVHRGLGVVDIQWPYGNERMSPDEVIRVDPRISAWLPPEFDQSYDSYDIQKARSRWASANQPLWRGTELPAGFYTELARSWRHNLSEIAAYDSLWHRHASTGASDEVMRDEVAKFYRVAYRLTDLFLSQHVAKDPQLKTAAYWVAQNRQYRVTSEEFQAKRPVCPKCATRMRKTTYKMAEGSRMRLFACPKDLFLIRINDILGPQGEPVAW
jgi:hypothetical protein